MKIVTAVVNNPVFIEIQYYTLKKYFKGSNYEFIVFNDAKDFPDFTNFNDVTIKTKIEEVCSKLDIKCINIPNDKHKKVKCAAIRCADSMNYILNYQKENPDKYLLIDSDMFLIDDFDINNYLKYHCAVVLQSRCINDNVINYFWNGIYYFDFTKMNDIDLLDWSTCDNCDVGGMMQEWLSRQMQGLTMPMCDEIRWSKEETFHTKNIYCIKSLWSCSWDINELPKNIEKNEPLVYFLMNDVRNINGKFFCEIYDNVFLHYRAGGNWRNEGIHMHSYLTEFLKNVISK
jgi:hypothetical protein